MRSAYLKAALAELCVFLLVVVIQGAASDKGIAGPGAAQGARRVVQAALAARPARKPVADVARVAVLSLPLHAHLGLEAAQLESSSFKYLV